MNDKERREKRRRRWLINTERLRYRLDEVAREAFDLMKEEIEDWECHEWSDGIPPTLVDHPLWQLLDKLEDCECLAEERVQALGDDQ